MLDRARQLSRVQQISLGIVVLLIMCCSCLGFAALLPSSANQEVAENASGIEETQLESENAQLVATVVLDEKPTNIPKAPTDTPDPTMTPQLTNTLKPPQKPTNEPENDEANLINGEEVVGDLALVTRIIDGDTIEVEMNGRSYRVRYIGMDTPERGRPFFSEATEANRQLVEGQTVIMVKDVSETDRYGRLLRYIYLQDGTFVNAELVKEGFALLATFPPDVAHVDEFTTLQEEARHAGLGLWAETVVEVPASTSLPLPTNTFVPQITNTPLPVQPTDVPAPQPTNTSAAPLPTETPLPPPEPPAAVGNVVITSIFFDGNVPQVESDEFAEISNQGSTAVNLSGWRLNADDSGQDFWFPAFDLQPGHSCRVYTNESHPETCGFSFGSGKAIWANSGECGHLYDASGLEVSTRCY